LLWNLYNVFKTKSKRVKDHLALLSMGCHLFWCNYIITHDIFNKCKKNDKDSINIYEKSLICNINESNNESNSDLKLCTNLQFDVIIRLPGHGVINIKFQYGYTFCYKCLRETHCLYECEIMKILGR
jgi:hypothetical protein